jgi:MFS family permease
MNNQKSTGLTFLDKVISFMSSIIGIMNLTAGIIGGIWLLLLGLWQLILYSVIISFFMPTIYTIVTLPALGIGMWGVKDMERERKIPHIRMYLSSLWYNFTSILWVSWVFGFYTQLTPKYPLLPLMLFAYSTAISPLTYMASHEDKDSLGTFIGVFYAECYALFLVLATLLGLNVLLQSILLYISLFYVSSLPLGVVKKAIAESFKCNSCGGNNLMASKFCNRCGKELMGL